MGAMFIGQQYLQNVLEYSTLDAGTAIIPAAIGMIADSAALGEADRVARLALHAARWAIFSACSASSACCCSGTRALRTGRSASPTCWSASASGFAGTPASHSLTGSVPVARVGHGVGHQRPAARPRRRDHAVDPRRRADRRLRGVDLGVDRLLPGQGQDHRQRPVRAAEVVLERRRRSPSSTRSTRSRSSPPPASPSSTATIAPTSPGSSRSCSAPLIVRLRFPSKDDEAAPARRVRRRGRRPGDGMSERAYGAPVAWEPTVPRLRLRADDRLLDRRRGLGLHRRRDRRRGQHRQPRRARC